MITQIWVWAGVIAIARVHFVNEPNTAEAHCAMKNFVLLNTRAIDGPNMTEMDISTTKVLPTEMLKAVLEKLDYKSLCSARQICKRWKNIIDGFDLVEKAFGKHLWKCSTISHVFAQTQTYTNFKESLV